MNYTIKKAIRDLAVGIVGIALYAVATLPVDVLPSVGVPDAIATAVTVVALGLYRQTREHSDILQDLDEAGR